MKDFQSVKKSSLYVRFVPQIAVMFLNTIILAAVLVGLLIYFKYTDFLAIALTIEFVLFIIISLVIYVSARLEYSNLQYLIEEDALFLKEGVLKVDTETIPFQKIRNASFLQSFTQRIFNVGDLVIDQEPESYTWGGVDLETARIILDAVAEKSNIQPITVSASQPFPLKHHLGSK
jgi:uncharacterized membrane protein YdbT with pleckstrin-like domain